MPDVTERDRVRKRKAQRGGIAGPGEAAADKFLAALPRRQRVLVAELRKVVHRIAPRAEESVVWNCVSYHRPSVGGRVKGAVCQIVVRRGQVRLDFIHGSRLSDPEGLLRGDGVSKRFVPIETLVDARRQALAALIRKSAELDLVDRPANRQPRRA
jgi:hypothetical protein